MTTIVLADDHHIVRQGIRALLEVIPDFTIIGEVADGLEVTTLVEALQPDILILDIVMPGLNGLDAIGIVKQRSSKTDVIILSMHANEAYVLQALRNGANGYVLKDASAEHLVEAIHTVLAGQNYLSPPLTERAIEAYVARAREGARDPYDTLTSREREVMNLAADGQTVAQIAERLSISSRTVETHRTNLMRKLGLRNQTDLVRYAIKRGIVPLED